MSRQNKQIKKKIIAAMFTKMHQNGERGPKATIAKHGKRKENRSYNLKRKVVQINDPVSALLALAA